MNTSLSPAFAPAKLQIAIALNLAGSQQGAKQLLNAVEKGKAVVGMDIDDRWPVPRGSRCELHWRNLLGQRYVQYFNRRHGRTGTLWEGRFRSCIAESARYVLACYRYIELNPVRAGMVDHPYGYLWSSYAVNSGMRADPMVVPHLEFTALGLASGTRYAAYRALVEQPLGEELLRAIRDATNADYPLASDAFKAALSTEYGRRTDRQKPGRKAKEPAAAYAAG